MLGPQSCGLRRVEPVMALSKRSNKNSAPAKTSVARNINPRANPTRARGSDVEELATSTSIRPCLVECPLTGEGVATGRFSGGVVRAWPVGLGLEVGELGGVAVSDGVAVAVGVTVAGPGVEVGVAGGG